MTDPIQLRTLTVTIDLPAGLPATPSVLHVRVQDVSMADRAAPVLVAKDVPIEDPGAGGSIEVVLEIPEAGLDPRALPSVFAHLDVASTGEVKVGDALTTQSFPVLTRGAPDQVRVSLTRI